MSSLRLLVLLSLLPLAEGCETRCCIDESTGQTKVVEFGGRCPRDFTEVGFVESEDGDAGDECRQLAADEGLLEESFTCEDFCTRVNEVCVDPACVESCEEFGDGTPSDISIDCVNDATSCQETNSCFSTL